MVGIVIVSHSTKIAEGIQDLIAQMVADNVPLAMAAGLDGPDETIGTDPIQVLHAIEAVFSSEGVVVLMDIGSALMSAETALEFLPSEKRAMVVLCEAPIIEGGLAAAVTAAAGGSIEQVIEAARNALGAKQEQMAKYISYTVNAIGADASLQIAPTSANIEKFTAIIPNRLGLHMRPAAKLVNLVQQHAAAVTVYAHGKKANALNINQLVTLGAMQGDEVIFEVSGEDKALVRQKIERLIQENFEDRHDKVSQPTIAKPIQENSISDAETILKGIGVSAGFACGIVNFHKRAQLHQPLAAIADSATEWQRLRIAIQATGQDLLKIENESRSWLGTADTFIFTAQRLMLKDADLLNQAQILLREKHYNAETAWRETIRLTAERYHALKDEHLRRRSQDVFDLGHRVLTHLNGGVSEPVVTTEPHILVARELTPSEVNHLNPILVLGLLLANGTMTDHSVILARALGIPTIVGIPDVVERLSEGEIIALDGYSGHIWLAPTAAKVAEFRLKRHQWLNEEAIVVHEPEYKTITQDGHPITLALNLNTLAEVGKVAKFGAYGIGLCRSEHLFAHLSHPPTEEEQTTTYKAIASQLEKRPFVIRLFDFGGDKAAAFVPQFDERNPTLGLRGMRLLLEWPELLQTQLYAILRASYNAPIQILIPMVSAVDEVQHLKVSLAKAKSNLQERQLPFNEQIKIGIMVETPAAVMMLPQLAAEVDFLSIGTNDLTQYIMAVERGNSRVAHLNNMLQPAVLKALAQIALIGQTAALPITVCGEMAGHPLHLPLLLGLGFSSFSMNPLAIPQISALIRKLTRSQAVEVAGQALELRTATAVEQVLTDFLLSLSSSPTASRPLPQQE